MKKLKYLFLHEESYEQERDEIVTPYLQERETVSYLERENGKKIYCVSWQADEPVAVVVISHGFTESVRKYEEAVYYFLNRGFHVMMPEHCGHGHSYRLVEDPSLVHVDSYTRYVDDLLFVMEKATQKWEGLPMVLYGHSMGGGIAAQAAATDSQLVDCLILSSPMIRPQTGDVPWKVSKAMAKAACKLGKSEDYLMGHRPYEDNETFEGSASLSKARFDFYQNRYKRVDPVYQTSAASYGWFRAAGKLSSELLKRSYESICMPVLLLQAERDNYVDGGAQQKFMKEIRDQGNEQSRLIRFNGAKHEIYNGDDQMVERYWKRVFWFIEKTLGI